ncbi:hypothetical protein [Enterococcus sp. JM9B]|uniref:hypothetical protein n=1 Tax=Enterococcus sp. JM9B TaxID=1857216 RepID=UPI001374EE12|nr:hypothetical protein [Enterococcus sp. JM9B]KAF1301832.1 hypothetical protein BAU16_08065 [Enterococcus sp. JM9B]
MNEEVFEADFEEKDPFGEEESEELEEFVLAAEEDDEEDQQFQSNQEEQLFEDFMQWNFLDGE